MFNVTNLANTEAVRSRTHFTEIRGDTPYIKHGPNNPASQKSLAMTCVDLLVTDVVRTEANTLNGYARSSDAAHEYNREAVAFVENTVGPVPNEGLYSMGNTEGPERGFATVLGSVSLDETIRGPEKVEELRMKSVLVHEQAHSTGTQTSTFISIYTSDKDKSPEAIHTVTSGISFGLAKLKINRDPSNSEVSLTAQNSFFEEAFSEETASRYRQSVYKYDATVSVACKDGQKRLLPAHYVTYDEEEKENPHVTVSQSAYPANAIHLLSECSGVDIYQLMVKSRDPQQEVEAKRAIVQAVEGVKKGLYRRLRELPYAFETDEFYEIYDEIVGLVKVKRAR